MIDVEADPAEFVAVMLYAAAAVTVVGVPVITQTLLSERPEGSVGLDEHE